MEGDDDHGGDSGRSGGGGCGGDGGGAGGPSEEGVTDTKGASDPVTAHRASQRLTHRRKRVLGTVLTI